MHTEEFLTFLFVGSEQLFTGAVEFLGPSVSVEARHVAALLEVFRDPEYALGIGPLCFWECGFVYPK